jgi:pimeloyl-ACP methyl ester carboxylesterase
MGFNRVVQKEFNMEYERGCFINSVRLLMFGLTMTAVRVRQAMEAVSYAAKDDKTLPIVGGISGGGLTTAYAAALYSERMRGAFISGYVNTFRASIMPLYCCVDNYIPDILSVGEEPDIIALACPLPLLISSGTDDPIFPVAASLKAADSIKSVYAKSGAESNITLEVFNGGHEMSTAALMPWLAEMAGT